MAQDIGRIAYSAYVKSLNDPSLFPWECLNKAQQDAWRSAAVEVLSHIDKEHEQNAQGLIG